jgi:hypothetical protein
MVNKYIAWGLGGALVLVLGAFVFFWKSQDKTVLAPVVPKSNSEVIDQEVITKTRSGEFEVAKTAPVSDVSLDEVTKNIGTDMSDDQTAIDKEASAEVSSLEEGNGTINDLGQSYDESKY